MEGYNFAELISPYLKERMEFCKDAYGTNSREYRALYYQYVCDKSELSEGSECNRKHYEATMDTNNIGERYVERLYKRQATIDLTSACASHCRYCLRQNYGLLLPNDDDISGIINYLKNDEYLKEVLITGGDPFLISDRLFYLIDRIIREAPNIKIVRVGTRLIVQNPDAFNDAIFRNIERVSQDVIFEVALQVNHSIELSEKARAVITRIRAAGAKIYAQNVLLRNVNDTVEDITELYDNLRYLGVESHYLFHPVPIKGTGRYRMPLSEFLEFAKTVSNSGKIPGRAKPLFAIMTDIGKVVLYEGFMDKKDDNGFYIIKTGYKIEDRMEWHKGYRLPNTAFINEDGYLSVKYLDGNV